MIISGNNNKKKIKSKLKNMSQKTKKKNYYATCIYEIKIVPNPPKFYVYLHLHVFFTTLCHC